MNPRRWLVHRTEISFGGSSYSRPVSPFFFHYGAHRAAHDFSLGRRTEDPVSFSSERLRRLFLAFFGPGIDSLGVFLSSLWPCRNSPPQLSIPPLLFRSSLFLRSPSTHFYQGSFFAKSLAMALPMVYFLGNCVPCDFPALSPPSAETPQEKDPTLGPHFPRKFVLSCWSCPRNVRRALPPARTPPPPVPLFCHWQKRFQ